LVQDGRRDARLEPLAGRFLGMKPPRFPTVFEAVVNAFACQQLSLEVGLELLNRLATLCGARARKRSDVRFAFPTAQEMARLSPDKYQAIGFSRQKTHALLSLARAVTREGLDLETLAKKTMLRSGDACSNCRELAVGVRSMCCSGVSVGGTSSQVMTWALRTGWLDGSGARDAWTMPA
jgi:hypothetical protein